MVVCQQYGTAHQSHVVLTVLFTKLCEQYGTAHESHVLLNVGSLYVSNMVLHMSHM